MTKTYGLIFDVDGVIADTEAVNAQASIKVFADLFGVKSVQRADFQKGLGRGAHEYVRAAALVHNLNLTPQQLDQATELRQKYFLASLQKNPLPPFDGVLELIETALARDDFALAIATSSTREKSQAVLESARIPYQQLVYITGSDVINKKPHPQLFLRAAQMLNLPPQKCLVIEDAPDGIESAHAAGCPCIAVTNSTSPANLTHADLIVNSLTEVSIDTVIDLIDNS